VAALVKERLTVLILTIESQVSFVILCIGLRNELGKTIQGYRMVDKPQEYRFPSPWEGSGAAQQGQIQPKRQQGQEK